ncbi:hypothetical protein BJ875DRAFT_252670 [Amylocarpus encephaloides]|uniref:Uncharacterized protein n=1 Tax=Amylocarpus encephaloides TaxID=45428 RepID=A0A9P8C745_9HELO|nr:hypothetical protein BJ875DRAFT_252670 [Amylocarpus encephaloides]
MQSTPSIPSDLRGNLLALALASIFTSRPSISQLIHSCGYSAARVNNDLSSPSSALAKWQGYVPHLTYILSFSSNKEIRTANPSSIVQLQPFHQHACVQDQHPIIRRPAIGLRPRTWPEAFLVLSLRRYSSGHNEGRYCGLLTNHQMPLIYESSKRGQLHQKA